MRPFDIPGLAAIATPATVAAASRWIGAGILCVLLSFVLVLSASLKRRRPDEQAATEIPPKRVDWVDFYIGLAFTISQRSPDQSTRHGCIAVNDRNQIISCGYNGFVRGVDDSKMPQTRPEKYLFVIHAEENMLLNMVGRVESGDKVFITGTPCVPCFCRLLQAGFRDFYVADRKGYTNPPLSQSEGLERLCRETGAKMTVVKPDLNWLYDTGMYEELVNLGFVD